MTEQITNFLESYANICANQTATQGFVSFVWDARKDAIAALSGEESCLSLDADVQYAMQAWAEYDEVTGQVEGVPTVEECAAWLKDNADDLIAAITESLND